MTGRVTLLGAGPGDPELLTLLGKRRLAEADVILYDRLVNPSLLAFSKSTAQRVDVGKLPHFHKVKQTAINQLLVDYAQAGQRVVRLKAGDPYVFGRGGEEAQFLTANHVPCEVVSGLTSAITGLAAVGIPITHRDYASSFHVITGHHQSGGRQLDWDNIAHQEGTLVFLMGMAALNDICTQLQANGRAATTPVAIIQWATQWRQRLVTGTLADIEARVIAAKIGAPALIVVGDVVKLARELQPTQPLQGQHVLLPYSAHSRLAPALQDQGATVDFFDREVPAAIDFTLPDLSQVATLVVTDGRAYDYFLKRLLAAGQDQRSLAHLRIVAANSAVAKHLRRQGLLADDVTATPQTAHALVIGEAGRMPTGGLATYRLTTVATPITWELAEFQAIIFPSSQSVHDFHQDLHGAQLSLIAMGPRVQAALQERGATAQLISTNREDILAFLKGVKQHGQDGNSIS